MLELWSIEPSPTPKDPSRHTLWVKGQLADVQALIRRFGAMCGRPQKERPDSEFDFSIFLNGAEPETLGRVETWLRSVGPGAPAPAPARHAANATVTPPPRVVAPPPVTPPPVMLPPEPVMPALEPPMPALEPVALKGSGEPAVPGAPTPEPIAAAPSPFDALLPPMQAPSAAAAGAMSAFADMASPGTPPPGELPPVAAPPPMPEIPVPSPELAPGMVANPFAALGETSPLDASPAPDSGAPPPLNEAPAWPSASPTSTAAAQPFGGFGAPGAAEPASPFGSLPPAPSVFPGAAPEAQASPLVSEPSSAAVPPAAAAPAPAPGPAGSGEPFRAPQAAPVEALAASAPAKLGEIFGAAMALNPFYTLDSLQVGSFNRFSHAASMSVISNPGAMYNPLFLFGGPGVGKTHLLHAIGKALQEQNPNEPIFLTTGPRLARAAAEAKRTGKLGELEAFGKKARALLIDDIHVLGVNEQNQETLVQVLAGCFSSAKQVVMTSVYPPRALGALEEALRFQISAGWSVDMKPVTLEVQKEIVGPSMARAGFELDAALIDGIIPKLEGSFGELNRWADRLRALLELRALNHQPSTLQDLFPILLMPDVPATTPAPTEEIQGLLQDMAQNPTDPKALPMAVFFPQGRDVHGEYVVRQFHAVMAQNKWPIQLRVVHSQAYDPEQLFGVPFVIGDACQSAGARVALVLGPNPGSGLASREVELQHAVQHLLEGIDMRVGWVNFLRIKEAGPYFRAGLDLFAVYRSHA